MKRLRAQVPLRRRSKWTPPPLPPAFASPPRCPPGPPTYEPAAAELPDPPSNIVRCPAGHVSAPGTKFCGQCGVALTGVGAAPPAPPRFGTGPAPSTPAPDEPVEVAVAEVACAGRWRRPSGRRWWQQGHGGRCVRPSNEDKYIEALEEAGVRSEFQTDRAAVLRAESLCEEFEASGEPKGGAIEDAAVESAAGR